MTDTNEITVTVEAVTIDLFEQELVIELEGPWGTSEVRRPLNDAHTSDENTLTAHVPPDTIDVSEARDHLGDRHGVPAKDIFIAEISGACAVEYEIRDGARCDNCGHLLSDHDTHGTIPECP